MSRIVKAAITAVLITWSVSLLAVPLMYVHDGSGNLGTVDAATGDVNMIGSMPITMTDIAFDPSGDLYGVDFSGLYSIDPDSAAVTFIGSLGFFGANALVFSTDGTLYTASYADTKLYTVNPDTGAATSLGNMGFKSSGDLAFFESDFYLSSASNELVKVDLGNIADTSVIGSFGVSNVFGLATGGNGILYAVTGTNMYQVDPTTGAVSNPVDFSGQGLVGTAYGESFVTEAGATTPGGDTNVPEPSSLVLALLGTALLAVGLRRRPNYSAV